MPPRKPAKAQIDTSVLDRQLLVNGAFNPLFWLLDSGHLAYGDYERWRQGELPDLDAIIKPDLDSVLESLAQLATQAARLGLASTPQTYFAWSGSGQPLTLSRRPELAEHLGHHWIRPADRMQLDLFMDNSLTVAENQLCDALVARRWEQADSACQQLARLAPNHAHLAGYEGLIAYGRHLLNQPAIAPDALLEEWQGLQQEVVPLARERLRQQARDYLAPAWRRIAQGLNGAPYDPARPEFHASHAWAQLPDWPQVIAAIRATAAWEQDFILVQRLAQASQQSQPEVATWLHCYLLRLEQTRAAALFAAGHVPTTLRQHWKAFHELEEELPEALFPAYVLIREPGLMHAARSEAVPRFRQNAVQAVLDLLEQRHAGADEIAQRLALKEVSPTLLMLYLGRKGVKGLT